jgi:hypothetical protein
MAGFKYCLLISSLLNLLFNAYINESVQFRGVLNSWLNEFNNDY